MSIDYVIVPDTLTQQRIPLSDFLGSHWVEDLE